jgi:hypothetical protein
LVAGLLSPSFLSALRLAYGCLSFARNEGFYFILNLNLIKKTLKELQMQKTSSALRSSVNGELPYRPL